MMQGTVQHMILQSRVVVLIQLKQFRSEKVPVLLHTCHIQDWSFLDTQSHFHTVACKE